MSDLCKKSRILGTSPLETKCLAKVDRAESARSKRAWPNNLRKAGKQEEDIQPCTYDLSIKSKPDFLVSRVP